MRPAAIICTLGALGLAAMAVTASGAQAAAPTAAGGAGLGVFRPQDVFGLQVASDPRIRPDGGAIAYVRVAYSVMTDRGERSIWLIDTKSGAQTPLVDGPLAISPRWSPDGTRLAYVAAGGAGPPQLYVRWIAQGVTSKVATLTETPSDITWSPDGRQIAFAMTAASPPSTLGPPLEKPPGATWAEPIKVIDQVAYRSDVAGYLKPGFRRLWVVAAEGGAPRQLTTGPFNVGRGISWTSDGQALLFSANRAKGWERQPLQADVYRLQLADGTLTQLTHGVGPSRAPVASPDGRQIAFLGYTDEHRPYQDPQLFVMDRDGGQVRALTAKLDRPVDAPVWARDGRSLYAVYIDHAVQKIARITLDGQMSDVARGLSYEGLDLPYAVGGAFSVSNDGTVAFAQGAADQPSDVALAAAGVVRRLTHLNADLFAGKTLAAATPLSVASSVDGHPIDAWLMTPPNFDPRRKYPLILEIHGGPYASYGALWSSELQLYAAAGYVVLYANPRGSASYGDAFASGIARDWPGKDYDDLMSAVDAAIAKGFVDPNNLFVTGGSGGGLLTTWIVGKTARFRAAVAQRPVINWTSQTLTSDEYTFMGPYWLGALPWEDPERYWRHSPLSLVGAVRTPTMLMVGEEDHRTPPAEAEQYYQALQLRGVPTAMVRVPGASHGTLAERPSHLAQEVGAIVAWFDRYRVAPNP
ncbi:MAG TPA: S9 family peptidase [Phenylobacterium sp.]|nr:S9 family peptidase [Phenylobacterium sp.]